MASGRRPGRPHGLSRQTRRTDLGWPRRRKLEHTGICRCFDRHVLLVQLRLAPCTPLGGRGLAGWQLSVSLSVWTGLSDALGLLLFPSSRWDYLEYLRVRHTHLW